MSHIALDAMGGDRAPDEIVAGGVAAAEHGVQVLLVGDEVRIRPILDGLGADLPIVHAESTVEMGEDPAKAVREKPDASVVICARLVAAGEVQGFVSAGSTGAAMASAAIIVGRLKGAQRPTIASIIPGLESPTIVIDSGANPEVKPKHLVQFALMGAALAEVACGRDPARVGLMSNGEERGKGRALERSAFELLEASPLTFVGNVEGRDLATGRVDVIVTDGFVGNVLIKTIEGSAALIQTMLMAAVERLDSGIRDQIMAEFVPILERMDYESTGGAHLLGVNGVVVIAHGSSSRKAIANAVRMASEAADAGLVAAVAKGLSLA